MNSFKHQYCKKIISSITDIIEIQWLYKINSTTVDVVKISSNQPSGYLLKPDECRNPLCNMRLLWLFTVDVARECTDVAFIQLNQLCQNSNHSSACIYTEGHFKAFKVIRFSDRIDKHLDRAFLRYLHIYLPWYSPESRSETLKDWSCFHRNYFLRLISALFRFCIAHSWYSLHISSCTKLRVYSNAASWQTLWFEFH